MSSVRYGARPNSPPRPAERPGAGRGLFFWGSMPLASAPPIPQTGPRKNRWGETVPRTGDEQVHAPDGEGRGSPKKYPPRARVTAGLASENPPRPVKSSSPNSLALGSSI